MVKIFSDKGIKFIKPILLVLVAIAAYLPVTQGNYLYHDDYYLLLAGARGCENHPQYLAYMLEYGRPLGIHIKCFYSTLFIDPVDANIPRIITLVAIALLGLLLYRAVKRELKSESLGLLTASAIITLPPFQTGAAMIANSTHIYAGIFGLLAAELALKIASTGRPSRGDVLYAIGGAALFIIALLIYQPGAFLYMVPVVLAILYRPALDYRTSIRRAFVALFPAVIGTCFYFIWFVQLKSGRGLGVDPMGKLDWFMTDVLPNITSFWSLAPIPTSTVVFVVFLLSVGVLNLLWHKWGTRASLVDAQPVGILLLKGLFATSVAFAAFLPNFAAAESIFVYRVLISIQPVFFVLVVCGLHQLSIILSTPANGASPHNLSVSGTLIRLLLAIVLVGGIASAHRNVSWLYVIPQTIELNYIREQLRPAITMPFAEVPNIHIVRSKVAALTGFRRIDEYGNMTTSFAQDAPWIVLGALRGLGYSGIAVKVTSGPDTEIYDFPDLGWPPSRTMPIPEGSIVIDMNGIGMNGIDIRSIGK
jgi:hypothetical protein